MKSMKKNHLNGYGKVAAMMAIFVLFMTPTPASAAIDGTSPNLYGDTIIGNETSWTNETFILNGNLIINSTGSLTL